MYVILCTLRRGVAYICISLTTQGVVRYMPSPFYTASIVFFQLHGSSARFYRPGLLSSGLKSTGEHRKSFCTDSSQLNELTEIKT